MASPRSLAMLVGVPAVYGFGSSPHAGFTLVTQNAGVPFSPNLKGDPRYNATWDADLCRNLGNIEVIHGNNWPDSWCAKYETEDKCRPNVGLREGGSISMSPNGWPTGLAKAYDICAWDFDTNKCRLVPQSFYCNIACPPPNFSPTKAFDPEIPKCDEKPGVVCDEDGVFREASCSKKTLVSQFEFGPPNAQGQYAEVYRVAETCTNKLYRPKGPNGRRVLVEEAPKVETRRKLQQPAGTCPGKAVAHTMKNGGICCDNRRADGSIETQRFVGTESFQKDVTLRDLFDVKEGCAYDSANDKCNCQVDDERTGGDEPACNDAEPVSWVGY